MLVQASVSRWHTVLPPFPSCALQTLCIEGHDMTIVAADGVPIQPIKASKLTGCLDINSGQR